MTRARGPPSCRTSITHSRARRAGTGWPGRRNTAPGHDNNEGRRTRNQVNVLTDTVDKSSNSGYPSLRVSGDATWPRCSLKWLKLKPLALPCSAPSRSLLRRLLKRSRAAIFPAARKIAGKVAVLWRKRHHRLSCPMRFNLPFDPVPLKIGIGFAIVILGTLAIWALWGIPAPLSARGALGWAECKYFIHGCFPDLQLDRQRRRSPNSFRGAFRAPQTT